MSIPPRCAHIPDVKSLRLATLNLLDHPIDRDERLARAAAWIKDEQIDVLCIQEVGELDGAATSEILADRSGLSHATPFDRDALERGQHTAVLTRLEHSGGRTIHISTCDVHQITHSAVTVHTAAGPLFVLSVHLAWGSKNEPLRLLQARELVTLCDLELDAEAPAVMAGDFNTPPDSDTVRYLRGRGAHEPATLWVDAWDRAAPADVPGGATSSPANPYARHIGMMPMPVGEDPVNTRDPVLDPYLLPERRIDFILSRGWRHGRAFTPTGTRVVTDVIMSDHYAVVTDLLLTV